MKKTKESIECLKDSYRRRSYLDMFLHILAIPIEYPIEKLDIIRSHNKKTCHIIASITLILFGSFMATVNQELVPRTVWDGTAYSIHGLGLAPIAKIIFNFIKIEI